MEKATNISSTIICCVHLQNSSNQVPGSRKMKLRSRSFNVVCSLIWSMGLSVMRPCDDPFKSKRLWIAKLEQKRFPIITNRTCTFHGWLEMLDNFEASNLKSVNITGCWSHSNLFLYSSCKFNVHTVQTKEFSYQSIFKSTDVFIIGWKHPKEYLFTLKKHKFNHILLINSSKKYTRN